MRSVKWIEGEIELKIEQPPVGECRLFSRLASGATHDQGWVPCENEQFTLRRILALQQENAGLREALTKATTALDEASEAAGYDQSDVYGVLRGRLRKAEAIAAEGANDARQAIKELGS